MSPTSILDAFESRQVQCERALPGTGRYRESIDIDLRTQALPKLALVRNRASVSEVFSLITESIIIVCPRVREKEARSRLQQQVVSYLRRSSTCNSKRYVQPCVACNHMSPRCTRPCLIYALPRPCAPIAACARMCTQPRSTGQPRAKCHPKPQRRSRSSRRQ